MPARKVVKIKRPKNSVVNTSKSRVGRKGKALKKAIKKKKDKRVNNGRPAADLPKFISRNEMWKRRLSTLNKAYSPEDLFKGACEYFEWNEHAPYQKAEAVKSGDWIGHIVRTPLVPPLSLHGCCNYLCITTETFNNYEKDQRYFEVCKIIRETIYENKFDGAALGLFHAQIIARDLGLKDSSTVEVHEGKRDVAELFGKVGLKKKSI